MAVGYQVGGHLDVGDDLNVADLNVGSDFNVTAGVK